MLPSWTTTLRRFKPDWFREMGVLQKRTHPTASCPDISQILCLSLSITATFPVCQPCGSLSCCALARLLQLAGTDPFCECLEYARLTISSSSFPFVYRPHRSPIHLTKSHLKNDHHQSVADPNPFPSQSAKAVEPMSLFSYRSPNH